MSCAVKCIKRDVALLWIKEAIKLGTAGVHEFSHFFW
jgi:hypothetical protein